MRSGVSAGIVPRTYEGEHVTADKLQLTYRELAERLGISPDAARMKAKRAVKAGRWRIIAGNHPSDPVRVEISVSDVILPEPVGGEQISRSGGERKTRTNARTDTDALASAIQSAQDRIGELTNQLIEEKDRHRDTAVQLAQAETREMGLAEEIHRLEGVVTYLQEQLAAERRTWWQRLTGRGG